MLPTVIKRVHVVPVLVTHAKVGVVEQGTEGLGMEPEGHTVGARPI